MGTATKKPAKIESIDNGDWLAPLLVDVKAKLAKEPSTRAVNRMRSRILASISSATPARTSTKKAA
jgi:hypothetical protein